MGNLRIPSWLVSFISIVSLSSFLALDGISLAFSQTTPPISRSSYLQTPRTTIRFIPSSAYRGAPSSGRSRGGSSRGNCPPTFRPLMAIVPVASRRRPTPPEATVSPNPTFWFYVPYSLSAQRPAEFFLLDNIGNYVYRTEIQNSASRDGVIQIALPENVNLETNQTYGWVFRIDCEGGEPIDVWGRITRIVPNPTLVAQLNRTTDPAARAALYAEHGIWYDALTTLAHLYRADQRDRAVATHWVSLLESAGLSNLSREPLVPCCSP